MSFTNDYYLSKDSLSLSAGVEVFHKHVLKRLPKDYFSKSYLFVDSLIKNESYSEWTWKEYRFVQKAMSTTIVGSLSGFKELDEAEKIKWADKVLGGLLAPYIQSKYATRLEKEYYILSYTPKGASRYHYPIPQSKFIPPIRIFRFCRRERRQYESEGRRGCSRFHQPGGKQTKCGGILQGI